eukprot:CAMPEP_0184333786 /NCGR_PEP_ID=MMETSP1089-20130417/2752_1 /TAXON_ID=38269 ORGANISM="Gloeochaete wittrockiana, Strain SAG46.84" /NCGR_SAMPLE_ID=MMETSP1089 /ASSEMBLY_ACC=CAM_ASM_000445 /LENGTH=2292 /DNA_ID=CAMNT_0026657811 /DNA_START=218 /DNA_END=7096 /DNA_ORIENTATION=+
MTPSITSSKLAVLMVVGLLACSGLVSAGYPVRAKPYPIQTATAHIDHFVPNNVDRVEVVDFTVLNFGAAVLDFESLNSAQRIDLNLGGAVRFDGNQLTFGGSDNAGPINLSSDYNDISINAHQNALFQSRNDVSVKTDGGDLDISTEAGDITVHAGAAASFSGSSVLIDGRHADGGVNFNSNADINVASGNGDGSQGQTGLTGRRVYGAGDDVTFTSTSGDLAFDSANNINLNGGSFNSISGQELTFQADAAGAYVAGQDVNLSSGGSFNFVAPNGIQIVGLTGTGSLTAANGAITVNSNRRVDLVSINGGLLVRARNGDISATAGQSVDITLGGALLVDSAQDVLVSSTLLTDYGSDGDFSITGRTVDLISGLNAKILSALTFSGVAKTSVTLTSVASDTYIESGDKISFESTGSDVLTTSANLILTHDVSADFAGRSVSGNPNLLTVDAGDDLTFQTTRDFINTATGNFDLSSDYSAKISVGGAITASTKASDIRFTSGDNLFFSSGTKTTLSVASDFTARASEFIRTNVTGAYSVTSQMSSVSYTFADSFDSLALNNNVFSSVSFNANIREIQVNSTNTNLSAGTSIAFRAKEVLQLSADVASLNVAKDLTFTSSGIIGDFNGDATFRGKTVGVTSQGSNIDARDDATFDTQGGSDITVTSDNLVNVHARFNGDIVSKGAFKVTAANNINVLANDDFGGEWKAIAAKSINLEGGALIDSSADRHELFSARNTILNFSSLSITIDSEQDLGLTPIDDKRNENLFASSGNQNFITSQFSVNTAFGSSTVIGDSALTLESSTSSLSIATFPTTGTSADDIRFVALDDITISAFGKATVTSDDIHAKAIYNANLSGKDIVINGDNLVSFRSSLLTSLAITGLTTIASDTYTEQAAGANLLFTTTTTQISAGNAFVTANGGGVAFHASGDITFDSKADWKLEAVNDVTYDTSAGNFLSTSNGQTTIAGGYLDWTTGASSSLTFNSLGGISVSSSADEPTQLVASKHLLANFKTLFTATAANNITVRTEGLPFADICLRATDATCKQSYTGAGGVYSSSATNSTFLANEDIIIVANSGSVGITSNGNQTDPFNDIPFIYEQRVGVLLRTTDDNGAIRFSADAAGADFYGNQRVDSIADQQWSLTASTDAIFIAKDHLANVTVRARDGPISSTSGSLRVIAGTSNSDGAVHFNSTGSSFFQADSNINILQEGTRRDSNVPAISIHGTQGGLNFQASTQLSIDTSIADGNAFFKTVNGDMDFFAGSSASFNADSGLVKIEGQTGLSFESKIIDVTATGGTATFNSAPGVGDVVIKSDSITLDAPLGEINFSTFLSSTISGTSAITVSSRCATIYGGGSVELISSGNSLYTASIDTSFKSLLETTIEAGTNVAFRGTNGGVINIHTGGDQLRSGFTASAVGDLTISSALNFNATAITTQMQFQDNLDVSSDSVRLLALGGNAGSGDNIVLQAVKGDFLFDSTGDIQFSSVLATLFKTEGPSTFSVVLDPFSESKLFINSGGSIEEDSSSVIVKVASLFQTDGRTVDWNSKNDMTITATTGYFYVTSEDYTTVTAPAGITLKDQTNSVSLYTDAANSAVNFIANGPESNINLNADNDITFSSVDLESATAQTSNYESLTSDVLITSTIANITSTGAFSVTSVNDLSFLNNPASHFGIYFGAGLENPGSGVVTMASNVFTASAPASAFNVLSRNTALDVGTDLVIDSVTNTFNAERSLTLTSGAVTSISGDNSVFFGIYGNANNLDDNNNIQTSLLNVKVTGDTLVTASLLSMASSSDLTIFNTGNDMVYNSVNDINVKTNGNLGSIFDSTADILLGLNPAASENFNALSSIFILSNTIDFVAVADISMTTSYPGADVLNAAFNQLLFDVTNDITILTSAANVPSQEKLGDITFTANDIDVVVPIFEAEANRLVAFNAYQDITLECSASISVTTGLEILFDSLAFISTELGSTLDILTLGAFSDIELKSATSTDIQTATGSFAAANVAFDASNAFLQISPSLTFSPTVSSTVSSESAALVFNTATMTTTAPFIDFDVKGPNGLLYMTASTNMAISTTNTLNVNSGRNINVVNNNPMKYSTMSIASRNNVIFEAKGSIAVSLNALDFRTEAIAGGVSGDIKINSGRSLSLTSTTSQATVRARNNLGNTGARILTDTNQRNHNEFAIEIQAIDGDFLIQAARDVLITSRHGDVELRADYDVRFNGQRFSLLGFFSQTPAVWQGPVTKIGDYCAGSCNAGSPGCGNTQGLKSPCGGCSMTCPELSNLINSIIDALVRYGLLLP